MPALLGVRRLERAELERFVGEGGGGILAAGGSIVTERATYGRLRTTTVTVWLRAKPEEVHVFTHVPASYARVTSDV